MRDTLKIRVSRKEKEMWQRMAQELDEDLHQFVRKAVRLRIEALQAGQRSPWDDLLGSVRIDAPPATNQNVRRLMGLRRA